MVVRDPATTLELMTGLLGYTVVDEAAHRIALAVNGDGPGKTIDVAHARRRRGGGQRPRHRASRRDGDRQRGRTAAPARGADRAAAARSPRCATAATSSRSTSASRAACCSRWRRRRPGSPPTKTLSRSGAVLKLPPWEEPHRADIESAAGADRFPRSAIGHSSVRATPSTALDSHSGPAPRPSLALLRSSPWRRPRCPTSGRSCAPSTRTTPRRSRCSNASSTSTAARRTSPASAQVGDVFRAEFDALGFKTHVGRRRARSSAPAISSPTHPGTRAADSAHRPSRHGLRARQPVPEVRAHRRRRRARGPASST